MKTRLVSLSLLVLLIALPVLRAALVIPGADGSDGALVVTTNTVIDLSLAVSGSWDANNAANAGKGIYDPTKWAVVFKYSSVSISAGATVTFKNHPSRAPVVWLVSTDATINGVVSLDGANGVGPPGLAEPGPGGFRGGQGTLTSAGAAAGFGPGGALTQSAQRGNSASYGTVGGSGPPVYGNPSLIPLLGGSGGGGDINIGGGAGGGALLIACTNSISVPGQVHANGGTGVGVSGFTNPNAGGGSGGGVRLVAANLIGAGSLIGVGGNGNQGPGGSGRIRLERVLNNNTLLVTPSPSVIQLTDGATALIWPPDTAPKVEVVSIGGNAAPADPRASFGTLPADVVVAEVTTTPIIIKTTNIEQASQVKVRVTPRNSTNYTEVTATPTSVVSTNPLVVNWTANLPVSSGHSAVIVRVVRP